MAPKSIAKNNMDGDFNDESSRAKRKDNAFPRVPMTETPELDYLSSTSESDFFPVSISKRGGTMAKATRAQARKARKKKSRKTADKEAPYLRPAQDVLHRIKHDSAIQVSDYVVGYSDRHVGTMEKAVEDWTVEGVEEEEFIPMHRIEYFKRLSDNHIIWHREMKIDELFRTGVTGLADDD
ncbi:MAG: hypothetical protein Q9218_004569 [Villophora microphyllina]